MDTRFTCNNISFFKNKAMSIKTTALSSNMPHPLYSWCKSRHVGDLWIIFGWEISILFLRSRDFLRKTFGNEIFVGNLSVMCLTFFPSKHNHGYSIRIAIFKVVNEKMVMVRMFS